MMIKQRIVRATMGIVLAATSSTVFAETTGWYFGVSGGQAQADINQAELDDDALDAFFFAGAPVLSATSSLDDRDTSWSTFGGYNFTRHFGVEASYIDLGSAKYRASGTVNPPGPVSVAPATLATDYDVSGFTAAVVGTVPIGNVFEAHARAGVLFAETEISVTAAISGFGGSSSESFDSRDVFFGLGAGLNFGAQWSINLDWQRFNDVGDEDDTGEADIDRISLGVIYRL